MTYSVQRWGNSLALRIPQLLARAAGLQEQSAVELRLDGHRIVIEPVPAPPTLERMLSGEPVRLRAKWTPGRGDVVSFWASSGGRRPALVLSPAAYSVKTGWALACPIESEASPFAVQLPRPLRLPGVVLADRVMRLDVRSSGIRHICSAPDEVVAATLQRLALLVGEPPGKRS